MVSDKDSVLTFSQTIEAAPAAVYYALTHTAAVRDWLCDNADVDARENGRLYLHWNQGYYASGEFTALEQDQSLTFTWQGRDDPTATEVHVALAAENGRTQVTLSHANVGRGEEWAQTRAELQKGWETGLANLKSVLETGLDKRVYDQPMLGIFISGVVDEKLVAKLGLPVTSGIHISGTISGTKAEAAGLQADDVVFSLEGAELTDIQSITAAVAPYKAGDSVELVYYRGGEKHTTTLEFSRRPVPDVPATPTEFASHLSQMYKELDAELDDVLEGLSDQEAATSPEPDEWSALQVLAHLILTERALQVGVAVQINNQALNAFPGNTSGPLEAIMAVYPARDDMVGVWKRTEAETVALVKRLPKELVARKAYYLQLGNTLLVGLPNHTRGHYAQIRLAIAAIRQGED